MVTMLPGMQGKELVATLTAVVSLVRLLTPKKSAVRTAWTVDAPTRPV